MKGEFVQKVHQWAEDIEAAQQIKARIAEGKKKLNERLEFIESLPEGEKRRYVQGFEAGLKLYEGLCDEYERITGHPVWGAERR